MKKGPSQPQLKKVEDYIFDSTTYAYGDHSKLVLAKKGFNSPFEYIVKCVSLKEMEKMGNLISNEINNAQICKTTNCTITFRDVKRTLNNFYLIYNYFDSSTLTQLISQPVNLKTYDDKLNLALNIAKVLNRLHNAKLMHRNLNPSHILVSKDLKNILFCGVKSIFNFAQGYPSQPIGSDPYMAPEMHQKAITHEPYDEKVDIYSFGVTLLQLFTGIPMLTELPNDIDKIEGISGGIKKLILNCLEIDPKIRISSSQIINLEYYKPEEVKPVEINIPFPTNIISGLQIFDIKNRESLAPYEKTGNEFGEGSYGKVIEVVNIETNIKYAMKKIKMEKLRNCPKARELIYGEINLLYSLRHMSFVITLIDAFHYQNTLHMVLELCNGGNLDKKVKNLYKNKAILNIEEVKLIAWNLAEGLLEMHKMKIVHRDLKPENVLLVIDSQGNIVDAKICDLGLGRQLKENNPEFTTVCGTELYMAPEIRQKKMGQRVHLTDKVDVYSYGLILYFMIFGADAYILQKNKKDFMNGIIIIPGDISKSPILELMKKCLEPNPEKRISFEEVVKSQFFTKLEIPILPNSCVFNEDSVVYEGASNLGLIDSSGRYWVKLYKQAALASKNYMKYIEREISFLKISKQVPHIVQIVDFGKYKDKIAIIFNYCNGEDLYTFFNKKIQNSKLNPSKIFSIDEIKLVAKSLIEFIDNMQGRNYIHRGINPSHILVEIDSNQNIREIKISGFRSSKSEDQSAQVSMVVDNAQMRSYFDPTALEEGFSEESDLWSIGLVIYFMATGQPPVDNIEELRKIRAIGKISLPQNLDSHLKRFIEFCIRKRDRGSIYSKVLVEEIAKEGIQI